MDKMYDRYSLNKVKTKSEKNPFQSLSKKTNEIVVPKEREIKCHLHCLGNQSKSPVTVSAVDDLNVEIFEDSSECKHNIVDDYIDITPDRSMKIKYCDICLVTF
jgi:hypothetical protein